MTDHAASPIEDARDHPPDWAPPPKTRARWWQEEAFLTPWRIFLAGAMGWAAVYVYWVLSKPLPEIQTIAIETLHDAFHFGVTLFLGMELVYYAFISWSFRRWRDWGMAIWLGAAVVFAFSLWNGLFYYRP